MMSHMIAVAFLLGAGPAQPSIPDAFLGDWYEEHDAPACSTVEAGDGRFKVEANEFEDPIADYDLTAVHRISATSIRVKFVRNIEDQNLSEKGAAVWTLEANGTRLKSVGEGDFEREYITDDFVRCKK